LERRLSIAAAKVLRLRYALTNSADINEDTLGPSGISNGRGAWSSIDPHNLPKNAPGVRWLRTPEAVRSALVFSSKAFAGQKLGEQSDHLGGEPPATGFREAVSTRVESCFIVRSLGRTYCFREISFPFSLRWAA